MAMELSKVYDPKSVEKEVYNRWVAAGAFNAEPGAAGEPFCIVIPPPNVTAALHVGHALNNTLQDVLIRWRRMQGYNALWMPGTDHAGIATQTVVDKRLLGEGEGGLARYRQLEAEGLDGRSQFVAKVQAWKDEYESTILNQLQLMGCSCDWRRTRFTMDEVCAKAVRAAFFQLFSDGLIYRGKRLVNWDPATQTVLADDEVEHEEVKGHFWYLRYPLVESGMGVPPMRPEGVSPSEEIAKRKGSYLPHWTKPGGTYAVTFRLADSLPAGVVEAWKQEREDIVQRARTQGRDLTNHEFRELNRLYSVRIDNLLDSGQGSCAMRDERIAHMVQDALLHFDSQRYDLIAWCVMPNHVHVVLYPLVGHDLPEILHSWKSYTAKQANKILGRHGAFWQEEYYDHLVRDEEDFNHALNYVLCNPARAGLSQWPWVGKRMPQGQDAPATHGRDAHATITHVTVATTRPETMLGDTAVAMNPRDPRAAALIGKMVRLPIVGRLIPIIADEHVVLPTTLSTGETPVVPDGDDEKARFSTGFLKVTPAHDPDDYAIRERCVARGEPIDIINVLAPDGTISDKHGWTDWEQVSKNPDGTPNADLQALIGKDRFKARKIVEKWFEDHGLLEKKVDYVHQVGHSYRSHVPIEPYLSDQWYIAVKKPIPGLEPAMAKCQLRDDQVEKRDGAMFLKGTDVPVDSLAGLALMPLLDGRLKFIPDRYAKTYQSWLENLRDWPISRQLWWGHRIPVWSFVPAARNTPTVGECNIRFDALFKAYSVPGSVIVRSYPEQPGVMFACSQNPATDAFLSDLAAYADASMNDGQYYEDDDKMQGANPVPGVFHGKQGKEAGRFLQDCVVSTLKRDPDVLDTWFSSSLWPFSTMGWPVETPELKAFYPGDVLCTAREIITLWVSRMVMMGQYCRGEPPFHDVFIHAMIQDGDGRKMSKMLGNGIDPLDIIDSHGADAMRFTLISMTTQTQDVRIPVAAMTLPDGRQVNSSPKFDMGRNFCNKLWNASRFAMMNLQPCPPWSEVRVQANLPDRWILSRLNSAVRDATAALEEYRFNELGDTLYHFMWDDFCDWYLEIAKARINSGEAQPRAIVAHCLDVLLRLLHPIAPFITEEIWSHLNSAVPRRGPGMEAGEPLLVRAAWPRADAAAIDLNAEMDFERLREAAQGVRNIKQEHNVPPRTRPTVRLSSTGGTARVIEVNEFVFESLTGSDVIFPTIIDESQAPKGAATFVAGGTSVYVEGVMDRATETARLSKQRDTLTKGVAAIEGKLGNANFVAKAPPAVVEKERGRLESLRAELAAVEKSLESLKE